MCGHKVIHKLWIFLFIKRANLSYFSQKCPLEVHFLTLDSLWDRIDTKLKKELSTIFYNTWITQLTPLAFQDGLFVLSAPNAFIKNIIDGRYKERIGELLTEETGARVRLLVTEPDDPAYAQYKEKKTVAPPKKERDKAQKDPARYTFSNFVRGKSNELAYAGSLAVADRPGVVYNPLFLYGGVGLGKTHLMKACADAIQQNFPNYKVVYVPSEQFTNELVASIQENKNEEFRRKYRSLDVLIMDDIQFIAGKEATQEEFFHTFNDLYNANKQIIMSSDKPPHEIRTLEDRLRSRFEMGLITDIGEPDYETRLAILQEKLTAYAIPIPEDVLQYIATNIKSNVRELEGALTKVIAQAKITQTPVTLASAQNALERTLGLRPKEPITVERIVEYVAREYQITPQDIYSKNRSRNIAYPRQISMYLSRELTDLSLIKIAGRFEKDHSTIIYGIDKIKKDMEEDESFARHIRNLRGYLTK